MSKSKIKFSSQIKPDFINELRSKVKDYFESNRISKYGNASIVAKSAVMISIYLVPFVLMLTGVISSVVGILICGIVMGIGMAGIGMAFMHDANHGTFSKNRRMNNLVGQSIYLIGGFPQTWQYQHNTLHHGFTNIDGEDEDIAPIGLLRFSPHKPLLKIHKYQHWYAWFFYGLMTLSWATSKDFIQLRKYKLMGADLAGNKSYNHLFIRLFVSKILYHAVFLVLPLLVLPVSWYWIVLGFVAMHYVCGLILAVVFQTAHVVTTSAYPLPDEQGYLDNNWAIHQLLTTSDFAPKSKIFSWFIGGLNYQVEHHLFPNISHVHYSKIAHIVKNIADKYGLPYHVQSTFLMALRNHAQMLKYLGR